MEQERVEYPSAFLVHAVKYIEGGVGCRMNKLALLKAVVCMLSTIDLATRRRVFHPLRRKEHEVLELVLVFFRHALQEAGSNFHTIRELWCPVQVCLPAVFKPRLSQASPSVNSFCTPRQCIPGFGIQSKSKTKNAENKVKLGSFRQFCFLLFTECRSLMHTKAQLPSHRSCPLRGGMPLGSPRCLDRSASGTGCGSAGAGMSPTNTLPSSPRRMPCTMRSMSLRWRRRRPCAQSARPARASRLSMRATTSCSWMPRACGAPATTTPLP